MGSNLDASNFDSISDPDSIIEDNEKRVTYLQDEVDANERKMVILEKEQEELLGKGKDQFEVLKKKSRLMKQNEKLESLIEKLKQQNQKAKDAKEKDMFEQHEVMEGIVRERAKTHEEYRESLDDINRMKDEMREIESMFSSDV